MIFEQLAIMVLVRHRIGGLSLGIPPKKLAIWEVASYGDRCGGKMPRGGQDGRAQVPDWHTDI